MTADDAEFGKAVGRLLEGVRAVEQWEKVHGEALDQPRAISCPCCFAEDALRYTRTRNHLYLECTTKGCIPQSRANCRGRRR